MAAFNFPAAPTLDQQFTPLGGPTYRWDGEKWKFVPVLAGGAQPADPTLDALAALNATAGLLEQTGADAFAKRALGVAAGTSVPTRADGDGRWALVSDLALKAPLASPTFTGTPVVPTAAPGTNTTQAASTAFVAAATLVGDASARTVTPTGGTTSRALAVWLGSIPATVSAGTYTLLESDHGKLITFSAACTVTVPAGLPANFVVALCQGQAGGQVVLNTSGATISEPDGFTKTAKQHAVVSLIATGSNTYLLTGRTGA